jgi:hypothetical protein
MPETIRVTDHLLKQKNKLRVDFCHDNGASVFDAIAREEEKQSEKWIGTQHFGYEGNRKPISLENLQEFITKMARSPMLKFNATLIIKVLGTLGFDKTMLDVEYVDIPDTSSHPAKIKQPAPPKQPTRWEQKKAKFFGRKRRDFR